MMVIIQVNAEYLDGSENDGISLLLERNLSTRRATNDNSDEQRLQRGGKVHGAPRVGRTLQQIGRAELRPQPISTRATALWTGIDEIENAPSVFQIGTVKC